MPAVREECRARRRAHPVLRICGPGCGAWLRPALRLVVAAVALSVRHRRRGCAVVRRRRALYPSCSRFEFLSTGRSHGVSARPMARPSGSGGRAQADRRRPLHPDRDRRIFRQPESLSQHPPTLVWIIWWVGLAMVSAFAGDLWAVVNPWRSLFDMADRVYRRVTGRPGLAWRLPYPDALGVWPGVGLLLAFAWIELVFPSPALPANIAWLALAYSLLTWGGMAVFGSEIHDIFQPLRPLRADREGDPRGSGRRWPGLAAVRRRAPGKHARISIDGRLCPPRAGERPL